MNLERGSYLDVDWEANPKTGSVKSNKTATGKTDKIILPVATGGLMLPRAGQRWRCRLERVTNPTSATRGAIIVVPEQQLIDCKFEGIWIEPENAQAMTAILQNPAKNLFLEGPQGCGKTTISRTIAHRLTWQFRKISGNQIKRYTTLYGRTVTSSVNGQTVAKWEDSPLVRYAKEAIANPDLEFLFFVDELTRMDEDARDIILDAIEGADRMLQSPKPEIIKLPRNIHWMFAGNVGAAFTVRQGDAALNDRLFTLEIGYMPLDAEIDHCLRAYPTCPKNDLQAVLKVVHDLRPVIYSELRLSNMISTRQTENFALLRGNGLPVATAVKMAICNQFKGPMADTNSERARLMKAFEARLK